MILPALESLKSVLENSNLKETKELYEVNETIDALTPSKKINHLDRNNVEVKPTEYYR